VLTDKPMNRVDAYRMVRRRAAEAGFKIKLGCHVFRGTGITPAYLAPTLPPSTRARARAREAAGNQRRFRLHQWSTRSL
jgi:hypothetical protein